MLNFFITCDTFWSDSRLNPPFKTQIVIILSGIKKKLNLVDKIHETELVSKTSYSSLLHYYITTR